METIDHDKLADAIVAKMRPPISLDVELWSAKDIAAYLKMSISQVMQRFVPVPSFPRPIRLPTTDGHKSHPRWKASEVIEWAENHQDKRRVA